MLSRCAGVLFDGFAYGMLLFLLSVGLSVTLGMMNFVNLAHCSFAMVGGYITVTLMNSFGWPFLATLPLAFLAAAAVLASCWSARSTAGCTGASDLDQCLLTIGIVFISVAAFAWFYTTEQQSAPHAGLPAAARSQLAGHELRRLPPVPHRRSGLRSPRCWSCASKTRASARRCARRSTTSAWRAASASTSTAPS